MDLELDPFDDIVSDNAAKNARPSGRFRPKAKLKPRNKSSASVQSTRCTQPRTVSEGESKNALENSVDGTVVVPPPEDNRSSELTNLPTEHLVDKECKGSTSISSAEGLLDGLSGDSNHPFGKSEGEKGDRVSLLEVSDGFLSQTTTLSETQTAYADTSRKVEVILGTSREARLDRGLRPCNTPSSCLAPELPISLDPLTHEEFTSNTAEDVRVENKMFEIEEGNTSPCLETQNITTEFTSSSGRQTRKLQPKPKPRFIEEKHCATLSNPIDFPSLPSQTVNLDEGSLPTNVSAIDRGRETTDMEHSVNHQQPSSSGQGEKHGRSLKRRRKQIHVHQLVDVPEEEDLEFCQFTAEYEDDPRGSSVNEDDHSDPEYQLEDERQNRKVSGKSKKPVRKHEKGNEVSVQSTKKSSKKFSHSTRKRGRFDKSWLKTPEDEIEISDLSLKEIIFLGEYRELTAKKNSDTSQPPVMNQSAAKSSSSYYEDDDVFSLEQGQESNDEQEKVAARDIGTYFNYHANMKKTPRGRWTNQDTELFYEALQQFGTDLTMITQLFPGRTRNQIKLKYKKEEREHPMRLHDALANRSKGHSHFEVIVNRVKKAVAERKQNSNTDDVGGLSGEELNEVPPETNEVTKYEQVEQSKVVHREDNVPEATGPLESSDGEDDERWSQFRSDL